ncbi:mediator of RNA polymerase II transcription subunit 29 isoform X1 [Terrapene carolina triunguis]|uniref:mediator of RNA polymerase II transcription subunit 29 isoform X1 n=1 Tax=Terrapene triunguis TaxID=2587831 RepID=UPI000E77A4D4|nr:mediator of RNA polymerase II transcription subunit 29 isoform X1 [Terrapene carolina triunguis]
MAVSCQSQDSCDGCEGPKHGLSGHRRHQVPTPFPKLAKQRRERQHLSLTLHPLTLLLSLALQNLMKIAAQNLVQNTNIDNGQKSNDGLVQRFDKSLEEFYALCDQLELCLRLAYECLSQSFDSTKHSPNLVPTATKPDAVQTESLPYTQYLSMIKSQISCAKDIHNALLECSNKITGKIPAQGGP